MAIEFKTTEHPTLTIVEFEIPGGVLVPAELKTMEPPQVTPSKGVVLSGRGPVWLFAFLTHFYHPTAWVGTFAPSEGGAVVVETHSKAASVGEVIPLSKSE